MLGALPRRASATSSSTSTRTRTTRSTGSCSLLAAEHRNLMVVGDDDQSIYGWRGADIRNILEFEDDFGDAAVVRLEENYRSHRGRSSSVANAVVAHNTGRKPKKLCTSPSRGRADHALRRIRRARRGPLRRGEIERLLCAKSTTRTRTSRSSTARTRSRASSRTCSCARARRTSIVGGTRFFERAEIRDVLAYLRAVVNPADDVSLGRIVNTPRRGIGNTTLSRVTRARTRRRAAGRGARRARARVRCWVPGRRPKVDAFCRRFWSEMRAAEARHAARAGRGDRRRCRVSSQRSVRGHDGGAGSRREHHGVLRRRRGLRERRTTEPSWRTSWSGRRSGPIWTR